MSYVSPRRMGALGSRIFLNSIQLWARILMSKYGGWSDLSNGRDKAWHSQWWKDLRKLYQQPEFTLIHQQMVWMVGGGEKIKCWKDKWLGDDCQLEQQYNQLFLISGQQNSTISNMGSFSQGNWCWGLKWRRNLFDYEQHIVVAFMEAITDIQIQAHMQDITYIYDNFICIFFTSKILY